ncbi:MAG: GIY-YIG nuclease family protein, partial [Lachnospiraceae bacterium]|nr:GIY-YIG nuclease family protein [Lachnospiraceae bacterium]
MTSENIRLVPHKPGIYCIVNTINNKKYIGQSVDLGLRLRTHYRNSITNRYSERHLYKAMTKYSIQSFSFYIIEYIEDIVDRKELKALLNSLEVKYVSELKTYGRYGYNETKGGESKVGWCPGYDVREKISESNKQFAKEQYEKIAEEFTKSNP